VDNARSELAVRSVKKRTQQRHQEDEAASPEALGKCLRIPRKKGDRPDYGQV
jgi:hypothetical protein